MPVVSASTNTLIPLLHTIGSSRGTATDIIKSEDLQGLLKISDTI